MLKAGVIEPAASEWASPVVLVPKPDGSMRFCVDYRKLNAITVRYTYPPPRMDECIDSLGDANIFTTLDCNSGYWQIPVAPEDMDKTTFTSHEGTFRFCRMPFGLWNAPATFQGVVDIVLSGLTWNSCLVYLDDIIVYSASMEEHLAHLDEALTILGQAGLSLKLAKCHFLQEAVDYLGHVIRPGKLESPPRTLTPCVPRNLHARRPN
jgi:Reverse transcriptase (RNA-dependent DNA polymerase)